MWRAALPLVDTFGRAETEFAACLLVLACVTFGDEWKAHPPQDIGRAMKEAGERGGALCHLKDGPIPPPDFRLLASNGFAEFLGDPDGVGVPIQFTAKGYEKLATTLPKCKRCEGTGKAVNDPQYDAGVACPKCGGRGWAR